MKLFTGITRLLRPDLTARIAHVPFVVLKGIASSVRCKSTLDNSHTLPKLESPDTADNADSSQHTSVADSKASGQRRAVQWTPEERRKLKDAVVKGLKNKAIVALFPTRSIGSIKNQRENLNDNLDHYEKHSPRIQRKWSSDEISLLLKLRADGLQRFNLRAHFPDRSTRSLDRAILTHSSLARGGGNAGSTWSDEDDEKLTELVSQSMRTIEIAEALGRSYSATEKRVSQLGIRFPQTAKGYTAEEIAVLLQMRRDNFAYKDISKAMGRSVISLRIAHHRSRPLQDVDAKVRETPHGRLSLEVLEGVAALRAQGVSWADIGRRYPMHSLPLIKKDHMRFVGFVLPPREVDEITRLKSAGKTWLDIVESGQFYPNSMSGIVKAYRRSLEAQQSKQ
jgi:hypothetical protein